MRRTVALPPTVLAAVAGLLGCERDDPRAAPRVYFGEDLCDVCSMIISDERFAAACVVRGASGRPEPRLFDDIGCLLRFESTNEGSTSIVAGYVRDYRNGTWLPWDAAPYVHSAGLPTPMASGLAALEETAAAEELRGVHGGDLLDLAGVREQFRRSIR